MSRSAPANRLRSSREERGMTQAALAAAAGISRQSLSAIEAGRADPSVTTALRIAAALAHSVEELFGSAGATAALEAELGAPPARPGLQRVALAFIAERWVAHPLASGRSDSLACTANGLARVHGRAQKGRVQVELLQPLAAARESVVLAGCAPALGVLAQRLNAARGPGHFLWLDRSSSAAVQALKRSHAQLAGVHLRERAGAEPNVAAVRRGLPATDLLLVTLASWQAGLLVRRGNPLRIRGVADLARPRLRIAARERGAGARLLLEQQLEAAGLRHQQLLEQAQVVRGHLEVGSAIALGAADVGLAMEAAALAFDLDFIPLAQERFDLVLPRSAEGDPRIARLLDALNGAAFRRELESLGGYDAAACGATAAKIRAA